MLTVQSSHPCEDFFERIVHSCNRVLLLDYDGTVAPFTVNRQHAFPYTGVRDLLSSLVNTTNTRLVIVTGRPAMELLSLLDLSPMPEVWGSNSVEHVGPDGRYERAYLQSHELLALTEAEDWLRRERLDAEIEAKSGAVAVHWRGLAPAAAREARTAAFRALAPLARREGLLLNDFDGAIELRIPGLDKADAVRAVLARLNNEVPAAYLGDDLPDEAAFRALRPGDLGVLVRPEYRPTAARHWIRPPEELVQFLADWILACGGQL
jgi:trehalose 6-phosphate phosphatase